MLMPTPTPFPEFIKVEFVSLPLLIWQVMLFLGAITLLTLLISKLNAEPEPKPAPISTQIREREILKETQRRDEMRDRLVTFRYEHNTDDEEEPEDDDEFATCSFCGTSNELDARSCTACGAPRKKAFA